MRFILIGAIALFAIACGLPALGFRNSQGANDVMLGLRAFAVGWSGILAGVFGWYANPMWALAALLAFFGRRLPAAGAGVIAVFIGCTTFGIIGRELPADEGNVVKTQVIRLLPGFYVWIASLMVVPLGALVARPK